MSNIENEALASCVERSETNKLRMQFYLTFFDLRHKFEIYIRSIYMKIYNNILYNHYVDNKNTLRFGFCQALFLGNLFLLGSYSQWVRGTLAHYITHSSKINLEPVCSVFIH